MNLNTVSVTTLLSTYHSVLIDVILILVFMLGFKFSTAYLMVVMTRWFEDEPDEAVKLKPAKTKRAVPSVPASRKVLWLGLAGLWILSGVVQFRPLMVVQSQAVLMQHSSAVAPTWLLPALDSIDKLFAQNPIWANITSSVIQLFIGLALLIWREKLIGKIALWVSLAFSLAVWVLWEGMGRLFHAGGSYLLGGPGAGLLYFLGALILLQPVSFWKRGKIVPVLRVGFTVFWAFCAVWRLAPWNGLWNSSGALVSFNGTVSSFPGLSDMHHHLALLVSAAPVLWNLFFVAVFVVLAVLTWFTFTRTFTLVVLMLWFFGSWLFGQSLGMAGALGLPLNSAPLLALVYLSSWWDRKPTHSESQLQLQTQPTSQTLKA